MGMKLIFKTKPQKIGWLIRIYNFLLGNNRYKNKKSNYVHIGVSICRKNLFIFTGHNNSIQIADSCQLHKCIFSINGNNNEIIINNNCILSNTSVVTENDTNRISIGANSTLYGQTELAAMESTQISIGEDCMFSSDILLRTGDSHSIINTNQNRINRSQDIIIGNHVWIGTKVICLKGTIIGDNCIVGAGSLLNKPYNGNNRIIAGTPAKIIKKDINWLRERI